MVRQVFVSTFSTLIFLFFNFRSWYFSFSSSQFALLAARWKIYDKLHRFCLFTAMPSSAGRRYSPRWFRPVLQRFCQLDWVFFCEHVFFVIYLCLCCVFVCRNEGHWSARTWSSSSTSHHHRLQNMIIIVSTEDKIIFHHLSLSPFLMRTTTE